VVGGSCTKQMTLNVDLDLSTVNSDIWHIIMPNLVKIGLAIFE